MAAIGFIGGGNMAEALIKGIITSGLYKTEDILVSDVRTDRLDFLAKEYGITTVQQNSELLLDDRVRAELAGRISSAYLRNELK